MPWSSRQDSSRAMGDIAAYIASVLWNWWILVGGTFLAVEPVTRFLWHGYDDWAARYLPRERRKRVARIAALAAFLIANYLAYQDQHAQLVTAQRQIEEQHASVTRSVGGARLQVGKVEPKQVGELYKYSIFIENKGDEAAARAYVITRIVTF